MSRNESDCRVARWRQGVPLSDAWLALGDQRAVEKWRAAATKDLLVAHRLLMVADLWARLRGGELLAFGKCVKPTVSDGPVRIPTHTFQFRPAREIGETDDFEVSGWRYECVTISRSALEELRAHKTDGSQISRKPGPKSIGPLIAAAIECLRGDDPLFDDRGQEKRIQAIRAEVARQNPARYPPPHLPGHTTVWNYLTGRKSL